MNEFPYIDIIILAAVAGFIIFRLRSVLGKRIGHEQHFSSGFVSPSSESEEERVIQLPHVNGKEEEERVRFNSNYDNNEQLSENITNNPEIAAGLVAISSKDNSFSYQQFIEGAKSAYEMALEAYSNNDIDTLKSLMSEEVYSSFADSIKEYQENNHKIDLTLVSILSEEPVSAGVNKNIAYIAIRFESEQIHLIRDENNEIISGDASRIEKEVDIWRFERNIKSSNPNWQIVAVRSE